MLTRIGCGEPLVKPDIGYKKYKCKLGINIGYSGVGQNISIINYQDIDYDC